MSRAARAPLTTRSASVAQPAEPSDGMHHDPSASPSDTVLGGRLRHEQGRQAFGYAIDSAWQCRWRRRRVPFRVDGVGDRAGAALGFRPLRLLLAQADGADEELGDVDDLEGVLGLA